MSNIEVASPLYILSLLLEIVIILAMDMAMTLVFWFERHESSYVIFK